MGRHLPLSGGPKLVGEGNVLRQRETGSEVASGIAIGISRKGKGRGHEVAGVPLDGSDIELQFSVLGTVLAADDRGG
jgi:hypothetical protein